MHKAQPESRDPWRWPFRQDSIWNLPIAESATYAPAGIKRATRYGMTVDEDILVLTPNAPLTDIYENFTDWSDEARMGQARCLRQGKRIAQLPIPAEFVVPHLPEETPNNAAAILLPDGDTIFQTQPFHRCVAGEAATSHYVFKTESLRNGDGIEGAHGGSRMSAIGGTLRLGELVPGGHISHALKINLFGPKNFFCRPDEEDGKPGYRWPALVADYGACTRENPYGGDNPELQIGSLLALPPKFDVAQLQTEPARVLARALQDYGAYVVDNTGWDVYAIVTEWSPDGRVIDEFAAQWGFSMTPEGKDSAWAQDMDAIFLALQVVSNNTPDTPAGGSLTAPRRAPLAPPMKP